MPQKPLLGFFLALTATAAWGALAIFSQKLLVAMNAQTLVWYRFMVAAVGLFAFLAITKKLPKSTAFSPKIGKYILLGIIGLALNFVLFSAALNYISPTTNQVLWQLAPFTMLIFSVLLFKETFGKYQKIGLLLLVVGLIAFFNDRFSEILQLGEYALGVLIGAGAAVIWVAYGIAQKLLLKQFSSQQVLFIIYTGCAIALMPFASPAQIGQLDSAFLIGSFIFCCLNTFIGYGAYGEALNHWDASKVSVITTLIPIFTMLFSLLTHYIAPTYFDHPEMNALSYIGAFIVVAGAILSAVGHKLFKRK